MESGLSTMVTYRVRFSPKCGVSAGIVGYTAALFRYVCVVIIDK